MILKGMCGGLWCTVYLSMWMQTICEKNWLEACRKDFLIRVWQNKQTKKQETNDRSVSFFFFFFFLISGFQKIFSCDNSDQAPQMINSWRLINWSTTCGFHLTEHTRISVSNAPVGSQKEERDTTLVRLWIGQGKHLTHDSVLGKRVLTYWENR